MLSISIPSFESASSPRITVLYRTLPRRQPASGLAENYAIPRFGVPRREEDVLVPEDAALRPDLRLERSDMGIRRVKEVADWFARWVDGEAPPVL